MKRLIYILLITSWFMAFSGQHVKCATFQNKSAQVAITNTTGKDCFFQLEGISDYDRVLLDAKGKHQINIDLATPAYYQYIDGKQGFHSIYLTPGSKTEIIENANGVSLCGDNAAINDFINQYRFLGHSAKGATMCSPEWKQSCTNELDSLCQKLAQSRFPESFKEIHKLYYQFAYYNQLLNAPSLATMFMNMKVDLADDYYAFLNTIQFNNPHILSLPKWFNTMLAAFDNMEKQQMIPVNKDRYMQIYASKTEDQKVRSAFLIQLLDLTLQKGYSDNFTAYVESIRGFITGDKDQAALKELENKYATMKEANKNNLKGMPVPEFTGVDVNGKEYKLSDFAGKVVILDFWFTGCIPCKAEMPFMEKIAESMKGQDIQFIAMSLDSGNQLMEGWKKTVKDKSGPVLNLNVPQGFKSTLAQKFGIRSVPRIIIVDKEGKIYDSNAMRPSDPKLKQTLEELLKGNAKEEVQKELMTLMQAETAEQKEAILKSTLAKFSKVPEVNPMLNMMLFQVIQAFAKEKKYEQTDTYLAWIKPSDFRRDVVFILGGINAENGTPEKAEPYLKEAAEWTIKNRNANTNDEDELKKLPLISKVYGCLLVSLGKMEEASQWVEQAYIGGAPVDFELLKSYAAVQLYKKEYAKASPVLEIIIKRGMGSDDLKSQLRDAYQHINSSDKGFDTYIAELLKESSESQKQTIANRMINEPAPLFTLKNMKGETVSLAALKGKVVILDFWATWCGPCKNSFPAMQKAANKYKNNSDVAFLFIDTWENAKDPLPAVKKFIKERGYDFNVLFDLKDPASNKCPVIESFGSKGIPAKYIIDKEGNIRFKLVGFSGSDEQAVNELSEMINILL